MIRCAAVACPPTTTSARSSRSSTATSRSASAASRTCGPTAPAATPSTASQRALVPLVARGPPGRLPRRQLLRRGRRRLRLGSVATLGLGVLAAPPGRRQPRRGAGAVPLRPDDPRAARAHRRADARVPQGRRRRPAGRPAARHRAAILDGARRRRSGRAAVGRARRREPSSTSRPGHAMCSHDLDLHLEPGTTLGVLGRTGSGKTSLGRLLLRFWDPPPAPSASAASTCGTRSPATCAAGSAWSPRRSSCCGPRCATTSPCSAPGRPATSGCRGARRRRPRPMARRPARRARHRCWPAARGCRPARRSSSPSPGCCWPTPAWSCSTRPPAGSTPTPRPGSRRPPSGCCAGRTVVVIAHRLATLDRVDEMLVLDRGRVVEHGRRADLAADPTSGSPGSSPSPRPPSGALA